MTSADTSPSSPGPSQVSMLRWWVCGLLFMATTLNYMDRQALSQMSKEIMAALEMDKIQFAWLEGGFSLAFAVGAVTTGYIVDRGNVRFVYPFMVFGWSIAGILTGFASDFWLLLACRLMLGFFEAGNWPCGIRTTRTVLKPEERSFGNSLFQSGTAIGAIVTPFLVLWILRSVEEPGQTNPDAWKLPFKLIGLLGFAWIALWFLTIPSRLLSAPPPPPAEQNVIAAERQNHRYRDIFFDPRFWALQFMVIAINVTWHTYRAWLPLYLRDERGYTREQMTEFTTGFYITADFGSWTAGLTTLFLIRRGLSGQAARMLAFFACAGLTLVGIAFPFTPNGWLMVTIGFIYAFASLGLFPTYFALTQEISAKHQGKVTGTLGAGAHLTLFAVMYPLEGWLLEKHGLFSLVFASSGIFPLIAFGLMLFLWPLRSARSA